jgi:5'-nucleotidase/Alpha/beta hydrolase family
MPLNLDDVLVVAITSRALFDLHESAQIYDEEGLDAYRAHQLLVLVAPMIPAPGEAPNDYWANTRYGEEVRESYEDDIALFYQDVPPELAGEALERGREQSEARMGEPSPLKAWPGVLTRVLLCCDDRLFPAAFLRRVARERLGIRPDEIDGGHTPGLSRPKELAERLEAFAAEAGVISG